MTIEEAINSLNDRYLDIEYYFAEHDCYKGNDNAKFQEVIGIAIKNLEEIQKYQEIGTVDECRIAVEKQTKKKRIEVRPCPYKSMHYYQCPLCGKSISINANFCDECGQAIDRGDIN